MGDQYNIAITQDIRWAICSIVFVFIYFATHLQSLFLAVMGIITILLSFGLTAIVNEGIIRNTYYSNLHTLCIFIVLGIAADDLFVFVDAWRQSKNISLLKDNPNKRLAYAFRRASRATFVTSSTTSVAFMANFFSPIMPIASFGIYAALLVLANYLLIILLIPPIIIFWEDNLASYQWQCLKKRRE